MGILTISRNVPTSPRIRMRVLLVLLFQRTTLVSTVNNGRSSCTRRGIDNLGRARERLRSESSGKRQQCRQNKELHG